MDWQGSAQRGYSSTEINGLTARNTNDREERFDKVGLAGLFCCPASRYTYPKVNGVGSFSPLQLQNALAKFAENRQLMSVDNVLLTSC